MTGEFLISPVFLGNFYLCKYTVICVFDSPIFVSVIF